MGLRALGDDAEKMDKVQLSNDQNSPHMQITNTGTSKGRLPARYVKEIALRYFGKTVHNETTEHGIIYSKGFYTWQLGDAGESNDWRITRLVPRGNSVFIAYADLVDSEDQKVYLKWVATVKRVSSLRNSHFILLGFSERRVHP